MNGGNRQEQLLRMTVEDSDAGFGVAVLLLSLCGVIRSLVSHGTSQLYH